MRQEDETPITKPGVQDPLKRLEDILENEDFENERISYVQLEPAPSTTKKSSMFASLRKKHPRAALVLAIAVGAAAWVKAVLELFEAMK